MYPTNAHAMTGARGDERYVSFAGSAYALVSHLATGKKKVSVFRTVYQCIVGWSSAIGIR